MVRATGQQASAEPIGMAPMAIRPRWRDYRTASGSRPIADFIAQRSLLDRIQIAAAMKDVRDHGLRAAARHLRGPLFEVRANGVDESYRLLFAKEGRRRQILLMLVVLSKKTQKTPTADLRLAEQRLADWHARGTRD